MTLITAIMVDGTFFIKRYRAIYGKDKEPSQVVKGLYRIIQKHVAENYLYRIFYYDCSPLSKKVHLPISKKVYDFSKSDEANFRNEFYNALRRSRKVALRLGTLKDKNRWIIKPEILQKLLKGEISISDLKDDDFVYDVKQKVVDIKLGLDIATLAYKKLVQQIVLISGDSDFVPAIKVARREGIDIVLDPMWNNVDPTLFEHIDGLQTYCPRQRP